MKLYFTWIIYNTISSPSVSSPLLVTIFCTPLYNNWLHLELFFLLRAFILFKYPSNLFIWTHIAIFMSQKYILLASFPYKLSISRYFVFKLKKPQKFSYSAHGSTHIKMFHLNNIQNLGIVPHLLKKQNYLLQYWNVLKLTNFISYKSYRKLYEIYNNFQ